MSQVFVSSATAIQGKRHLKNCVFCSFSLKQEKATQSNTDISFLQKKVEESFSTSFSLVIAHLVG